LLQVFGGGYLGGREGIGLENNWGLGAGVVICLELGAVLHIAQLMPLPLILLLQ